MIFALSAIFLSGLVGMVGASQPKGSTAIINVTYVVHNDADSGFYGYWALDNYSAHLTVWHISGNQYQVNVTDLGTWCTYVGSPEPNSANTQTSAECGVMRGGYDGNLTASVSPVNVSQSTIAGGILNAGGTENSGVITPGQYDGQLGWINYFFPGTVTNNPFSVFAFANSGNGWGWTYTDSNGEVWTDAGTVPQGQSGNLVVGQSNNQGNVNANAQALPLTCSLSAAGSVNFGAVVPGGPRVASLSPITVTDEGDVSTDVYIYGSDWHSSYAGDLGSGSIGYTVYNPGATYGPTSTLSGTSTDTGVSLNANGGSEDYWFGLQLPVTVHPASLSQTITFVSSC